MWKVLKILGSVIVSVLILMLVLPFLLPNTITNKAKEIVNNSLTTKVEFSTVKLSFFDHFPALTASLSDIVLMGSAPFEKDTLLMADKLSFGINLLSVFSKNIEIDEIYVTKPDVSVQVDQQGKNNYDVYKSTDSDTSSANNSGVKLAKIIIKNGHLHYTDRSVPFSFNAENLNYKGKGNLSEALFDLDSRLKVDEFSLLYDHETYVNKKEIRAKLLTRINTDALSLIFQENKIKINQLPLRFIGTLNFLQSGYKIDLNLETQEATFADIISAIPPDLSTWSEETELRGLAGFDIQIKGRYDAAAGKMPDFRLKTTIHDGYVAHKKVQVPVENIYLNMDVDLPAMNRDSLDITIDSLFFNLGKGFFSAKSHSIGIDNPWVNTTAKADLNLTDLNEALGLTAVNLKGNYTLDFSAKGNFSKGQNPNNWRKEIVLTGIPKFHLTSSMKNGYIKLASFPEAVSNINFVLNSYSPDQQYKNIIVAIDDIDITAFNNSIKGFFHFRDPRKPDLNADLSGQFRLGDLEKSIPMGDLKLSGDMDLNAKINGIFDSKNDQFPVANVKIDVSDGSLQTGYYPNPISDINMHALITSSKGDLNNTSISVQPLNFKFEGEPFTLKAELKNPEDISYDVVAKGVLNLGKIYQVFAVPDYQARGFIDVDVSLKGRYSDATAGRYHLLKNSGRMEVRDITLNSKSFPKPFLIRSGLFRFNDDKMWFDQFQSSYGSNRLTLSGYLQNVINYLVQPNSLLKGKLGLVADDIDLEEFTAFDSPDDDIASLGTDSSGTGVILIPKNLSLLLTANVKQARYEQLVVKDFAGNLLLDNGKAKLENTTMHIAGASFALNADYEGLTPRRGIFDFQVKADSFSIAKAYKEIPMFREMLTSAKDVQGIVGLDYQLSGRLNQNMMPIYPSLEGGGVLHLTDVKLKGFKMVNKLGSSAERDEMNDPDLKDIDIKTTVKNNIINLERVKFRLSVLRPRFEGQVSLDGELNIKGRIGLPSLGIFGIPFTVSGTSDDPVVKLKRDKQGKILKEKSDDGDDELRENELVPANDEKQATTDEKQKSSDPVEK